MPVTLLKPRLIQWNSNAITDHNRAPLQTTVDRIETKTRMANGTMRSYWIADKRKWTTSWDMLPGITVGTVDGFWGADAMESFFNTNYGQPFTLTLTLSTGESQAYTVLFENFSKSLSKRGKFNFYDVNVSLVEV